MNRILETSWPQESRPFTQFLLLPKKGLGRALIYYFQKQISPAWQPRPPGGPPAACRWLPGAIIFISPSAPIINRPTKNPSKRTQSSGFSVWCGCEGACPELYPKRLKRGPAWCSQPAQLESLHSSALTCALLSSQSRNHSEAPPLLCL